jgi:ribosome-associated protein
MRGADFQGRGQRGPRVPHPAKQAKQAKPIQPLRAAAPVEDIEDPEAIAVPKPPRTRPLDGEGRPYMTLAQFVKSHELAGTGGQAKQRVRAGGITVNGTAEDRPGRKLHQGDKVEVDGLSFIVHLK